MEYAVSRMKMLHVRDCAISVPVGLLGFNQGNVNFLVSTPTPCFSFFFFSCIRISFSATGHLSVIERKKKSGTWIEICQGNYNKMSAMNINFLRDCHNLIADLSSALITVFDLEMNQ